MNNTKIKTFKRFIKEEKEQWYSLDLYQNMTKEEVTFYVNQLLQLTFKMLKNSDVVLTLEPVLDDEEV
ncbi:hypothetical protein PSHI8_21410 [Polynucleobacter sp. SHI8]|uniref:hypothetical protein n=1 Tax=unclassified Polynucleobacter TaxID=2640945 RepID=UPI002492C41B|nr:MULTISPECIES: hypothetical protein [unclassified Polynucleobacter]BDW12057.1 hypothetical protein PSHI2_21390 [Polynucleobacter sp. SHI2]BDW14505.1 hypothetical protein PSHI8_21410 [Polynucleobacter sp. SHI8]